MPSKPIPSRLLLSITLPLLAYLSLDAAALSGWSYRHPKPHNQDLWKVLHEEGLYVMTGSGGVLTTSTDLDSFQSRFYPDLESLDGLFYANGRFIVTSRAGDILVSDDGQYWSRQPTGTTNALVAGTFGDGRYVLVGQDGTTATSTDLLNWTVSDTGDDYWYYGIAYGNGRFVAVSFDWNSGQTSGNIVTSTNGIDWSVVTPPAEFPGYIEYYDVAYANGLFVATGYFYQYVDLSTEFWGVFLATSPDGLNWTRITSNIPQTSQNDGTPTWLNMARYDSAASQWVATGDRALVMTSGDGTNWFPAAPIGNITTDFFGLGFGPDGTVLVGSRADIYASADLITWDRKFEGNFTRLYAMASNSTQHMAFGNAPQLSEDGGATWETVFTGVATPVKFALWTGDRYVIGGDSLSASAPPPIGMSMNGRDWTTATLPEGFADCRGLAYANGLFLAIPQGGATNLAKSADGLAWVAANHEWFATNQQRNWLAAGNGLFVAWSNRQSTIEFALSTDGTVWDIKSSDVATTLLAGAYGDGRWVFVGLDGTVATTTDFATWNTQVIDFNGQDPVNLEAVTYADGYWVIAGRDKSIWSSVDGLNWEAAFRSGWTGGTNIYGGVHHDGSSFWVVGQNGDILQSNPLKDPAWLGLYPSSNAGEVVLEVSGAAGDRWSIIASPDMAPGSWSVLDTVILENDVETWADPVSGNRFYRLWDPDR